MLSVYQRGETRKGYCSFKEAQSVMGLVRPERLAILSAFIFWKILLPILSWKIIEKTHISFCAKEYENVKLSWPVKPENKEFTWHKGDQLVARFHNNKFAEHDVYKERLSHLGYSSIEIKRVTGNDSGTYNFSFKLNDGIPQQTSVDLYVTDAPVNTCKPVISQEGSHLKAYLPPDDVCTYLRLEWKQNVKSETFQNGTSILHLGTDSGERVYMVCAVGEATKCFQGNNSEFCTNYTAHEENRDQAKHHESGNQVLLYIAIFVPIVVFVAYLIIEETCFQKWKTTLIRLILSTCKGRISLKSRNKKNNRENIKYEPVKDKSSSDKKEEEDKSMEMSDTELTEGNKNTSDSLQDHPSQVGGNVDQGELNIFTRL